MNPHRRFFLSLVVCVLGGMALALGASLARAQTGEDLRSVASQKPLPKRLVADYGYWSRYQKPVYSAAQIPFSKITTVNHAGVSVNADGTLTVPTGPGNRFLEPELLTRAHAAGVKVLVLLGGDFSDAAADPGTRATLVSNLSNFITKYNYDGVDIDWEYPTDSTDRNNFAELGLELRQALPSPTFLISVDVPPWGGLYPFKRLAPQIDYFNIMMYDCAGPWDADAQLNSPIFWDHRDPDPYECQPGGSADGAMNIYLNKLHLPASQLNMGTPFYGYYYTTVAGLWATCPNLDPTTGDCPNDTVLSENYGTFIKQRVNQQGWVRQYDLIALVPYLLRADGGPGFITYDDPLSTYLRVWYSDWDRGLGGTFMWSVDADYDGHSQDLLDAMHLAIVDGAH